jgi:hypothetical protein
MNTRAALKTVIITNIALVVEVLGYRVVTVQKTFPVSSDVLIEHLILFTVATSISIPVAALYDEKRKHIAMIGGG